MVEVSESSRYKHLHVKLFVPKQFPNDFRKGSIVKGSSKFLKKGNIVAVHWKDKRDVYVLSALRGSGSQRIERQREP